MEDAIAQQYLEREIDVLEAAPVISTNTRRRQRDRLYTISEGYQIVKPPRNYPLFVEEDPC